MDYISSGGKFNKKKALSYFASHPSHILPFLWFKLFNSKNPPVHSVGFLETLYWNLRAKASTTGLTFLAKITNIYKI